MNNFLSAAKVNFDIVVVVVDVDVVGLNNNNIKSDV